MRIVNRKVVGAYIFSSDGKVLLGHNKKGGTYQGMLVVPGGGIEENETQSQAIQREILKETGINISTASIKQIDYVAYGESEKTLKETNETVIMKMKFYDFVVKLDQDANTINLKFEDDFGDASWYTADELQNRQLGPNTKRTLQKLNFL